MPIPDLHGKRVTVMGLGINGGGVGVARFLARAGALVLVTDLKSRRELAPSVRALRGFRNITYALGEHRAQDFAHTDLVVVGPGVPRDSRYLAVARAHGVPITTDLGLFLDRCPSSRIIAVTGTKGKTTTTLLIAAMLRAGRKRVAVAGNMGVSPLDALARITPATWVVLELSSWQIEGIAGRAFAPHIGVITNILPDHLDRYTGFGEYAAVKWSLVAHQRADQIVVLNVDDPRVRAAARRTKARVLWWSMRRGRRTDCAVHTGWVMCAVGGSSHLSPPCPPSPRSGEGGDHRKSFRRIIRIADIPLLGSHNVGNVLAAATAARAMGVSARAIRSAVQRFRGVPHRLETVRTVRGVRYVNDSAATIPEATIAALASFREPIVLIAGGKNKNLDYAPLARALARHRRLRAVILLTHPAYTASQRIRALASRALANRIVTVASMREAVRGAAAQARRGDVVLLSPGAASFGMFVNEFDRGDQFRAAVRRLR